MSSVAAIAGSTAAGALGGAIARKLAEYAAKIGRAALGKNDFAPYKDLDVQVQELAQLLDDSIAKDKSDAEGFWNSLKAVLKNNFDYFNRQAKYEAQVNALITEAKMLMAIVQKLTAEPIQRVGIPDEIYDVANRWQEIAQATDAVNAEMPSLKETGEWGGPSAGNYHTMTDVQVNASAEYVNMPLNVAVTYEAAGNYNKTVLAAVHLEIREAKTNGRSYRTPLDGEFYVRTAAVRQALRYCVGQLPKALNMTQEAAQELASEVRNSQQAARIIGAGWPTGTSLAGQQAGNTRFETPEDSPEYDRPKGAVPPPPGVGRWG